MRDPQKKALFWLVALIASLSLLAYGVTHMDPTGPSAGSAVVAMIGGFVLSIAAALFFLESALLALGRRKLLADRGAIARWRVDAAEWQRFRALDKARSATDFSLANEFKVPRTVPPEGIEIVVGETGLLVGRSYHVLRRRGAPALCAAGWVPAPADPECLEFGMLRIANRYGGTVRKTLRVPVPRHAREQGLRALAHFQATIPPPRPPPLANRPVRTALLFLLVALVGALAAAIGLAVLGWNAPGGLPMFLVLTGGGIAIGGFAAFLIALAFGLTQKRALSKGKTDTAP